MALWDSVTGFFEDLGSFFSGKSFFEMSGYVWNTLMGTTADMIVQNPTEGIYKDTWDSIGSIYTLVNTIAVSLMCLFFVYGFCRDSTDLHSDLTLDRVIKMFIRLIITANVLTYAMSWMPDFMTWAKNIAGAVLGTKTFGFSFDGAEIYEQIAAANLGALVAFLTSALFFIFTVVCGFMIGMSVIGRLVKIYLIAPFCGLALSTLAGGGQLSQTGYSYIRTFLGYVFSILIIAVGIIISSSFVNTIVIETDLAVVKLLEYCLKMGAITSGVKSCEVLMQKAFNL